MVARASRSMSMPSGRISGSRRDARKITAMIGTPRQNSMNSVAISRMIGSRDARPSASSTPSGTEISAAYTDRNTVSMRPPHSRVSTTRSPSPPCSNQTPSGGRITIAPTARMRRARPGARTRSSVATTRTRPAPLTRQRSASG